MADDDAQGQGGNTTDQQQDDATDAQDQPGQRQDASRNSQSDTTDPGHDGKADDGKTFTQGDVDKLIADRINRERKKFADYGDLQKKAKRLSEIEDAQRSEVEKLNDQLTDAQVELQAFKVAETRRKAASDAGLDPELAEYITAADPDEALAQAKRLAERLKPPEPKTADFRQGSRPPAKPGMTRDDLIRGMAGHGDHSSN